MEEMEAERNKEARSTSHILYVAESELQLSETPDSVFFTILLCCLLELTSLVLIIGQAEGQLSLLPSPFSLGSFLWITCRNPALSLSKVVGEG